MKRIVLLFGCLLFIMFSCQPGGSDNPGTLMKKLESMGTNAQLIKDGLGTKSGAEYLTNHDKYYAIMAKRAEAAIEYITNYTLENKSRGDLLQILEIAKIAQDADAIVTIAKALFNLFPETRNEITLIQTYFTYAFLLEPGEVEKYV